MRRLFVSFLVVALAAGVAHAQDGARVFPGFEKVYKDSKKKEAEAVRAIAAAEAEIAASEQQRLEGERQMADADAAIKSEQLSYLTLTRSFGGALSSLEARVEANQLEAAARAWADAEAQKERGAKTAQAAEASRVRASDRLIVAQSKLSEARIAIARTLQDGPAPEPLVRPAEVAATLAPTPVDAETLPPTPKEEAAAPKEEAIAPVAASSDAGTSLDRELLGGPDGD